MQKRSVVKKFLSFKCYAWYACWRICQCSYIIVI